MITLKERKELERAFDEICSVFGRQCGKCPCSTVVVKENGERVIFCEAENVLTHVAVFNAIEREMRI